MCSMSGALPRRGSFEGQMGSTAVYSPFPLLVLVPVPEMSVITPGAIYSVKLTSEHLLYFIAEDIGTPQLGLCVEPWVPARLPIPLI